jgi:S-adenosylmethionine/arginine decarboxylase-like enzyme
MSKVEIITCEEAYRERMAAIVSLAKGIEELAKALNAPQVEVKDCKFEGQGITIKKR